MVQVEKSTIASDNTGQHKRDRDPHRYSAARIAGTYLIAGGLWIGLSVMALAWSGVLTENGLLVSVVNGLLFVLLSTGLVF